MILRINQMPDCEIASVLRQGSRDMKLTAYCVGLKKLVEIKDPELVTLKNGRKAVKGVAANNPGYRVFRILGTSEVAEVESMLRV